MSRPRIVTIIILVLIIGIGGIAGLGIAYNQSHTATSATPARTTSDYVAVLTKKYPALAGTGTPIFTVSNVTKLADNWYRVTITSTQNGDSLRALVLDATPSAADIAVVLGPSKSFNEADVPSDVLLPEQVYQEFIK